MVQPHVIDELKVRQPSTRRTVDACPERLSHQFSARCVQTQARVKEFQDKNTYTAPTAEDQKK